MSFRDVSRLVLQFFSQPLNESDVASVSPSVNSSVSHPVVKSLN